LKAQHPVAILWFLSVRKITGAETQEKTEEDIPFDEYGKARLVHPLSALDDDKNNG